MHRKTTNILDTLGENDWEDKESNFIIHSLEVDNLVYIEPIVITPIWLNKDACRKVVYSKYMDRCLILDVLLQEVDRYHSWIEDGILLEHCQIILKFKIKQFNPSRSFHFNT